MLLLSSVFVPLFGVILGRLAFGAPVQQALATARQVEWLPVGIWLAGIACYHGLPRVAPMLGAALPTLCLCFILAFMTRPGRR